MTFKDYFSERAELYAAYRPLYPDTLFEFLAGLTPEHRAVLDCGTGNGQAAVGLAAHFWQTPQKKVERPDCTIRRIVPLHPGVGHCSLSRS